MDDNNAPSISSFLIRFIQETPSAEKSSIPYRGFIRHIQTDSEISFTRWDDAITFIQKYVPLLTRTIDDQAAKLSE